MRGYNVLSLFGGIETGYAALIDAGIPIANYYSSEIDKNAIKAAKWNYPKIVHIGDVKNVRVAELPFVPNLLIGGFPCQDLSVAGKQAGLDGERSGLFFEAVRILRECQEVNPNILFLFENVPMANRHEYVISETLGLSPWKNNAALVSAQNRIRLWWSNISTRSVGFFGLDETWFPQPKDQGIMLKDILEADVDRKYFLSGAALERIERNKYSKLQINPEKTGTINCKNNSVELSIDSGTTLVGVVNDNGMLKQVEKSNCIDANFHKGMDNNRQRTLAVVACLNPRRTEYGKAVRKDYEAGKIEGAKRSDMAVPTPRDDGKVGTITTVEKDNLLQVGLTIRRLTPVEVCRLFTLPDNFFQTPDGPIIAETNQYKALGNGWVMKVVSHIFSFLPELQ